MDGLTSHALERMAERGITENDIEYAMNHRMGYPEPGNRPDTMVVRGFARGGGILKIVVSAADEGVFVSAMWEAKR